MHSSINRQALTPQELSRLKSPDCTLSPVELSDRSDLEVTMQIANLKVIVRDATVTVSMRDAKNDEIGTVIFHPTTTKKRLEIVGHLCNVERHVLATDPLEGHTLLVSAISYALANRIEVSSSISSVPQEIGPILGDRLVRHLPIDILRSAFRVREVLKGVILITAPSEQLLGSAFVRFQEYYEGPKFSGKVFTLREHAAWYKTTTEHGGFSYYNDWAGFNVPDVIFDRFFSEKGFVLRKLESIVRDVLADVPKPYYVIATAQGADFWGYARHELAHALYYLDDRYRKKVDAIVDGENMDNLHQALLRAGYDEPQIKDELQAYLLDGPEEIRNNYGVSVRGFKKLHVQIRRHFIEALQRRLSISNA